VSTAAAPPPAAPTVRPPREAKWLPTIAVFAVLLFVTLGGFLLGGDPGGIGDTGQTTLVGPISVSSEVRFRPADGWVIEEQSEGQVRVVGEIGALYVVSGTAPGGPEALLQEYESTVLEPQASQLSVSEPEPVALAGAAAAVRISYVGLFEGVGTPLEGEITAAASAQGNGAVLDGWAPEGQFVAARSDVHAMVDSLEVA
jgi:hypothetical protein